MGGTGNIIKGLEKLMEEEKIEIIKGNEVIKIESLSNKINHIPKELGEQARQWLTLKPKRN